MYETEPKYFAEFRKNLDQRLDSQDEQLAKVSEDVTILKQTVVELKEDVQGINKRLDIHFDRNKIVTEKVGDLERRTKILETHAFA